MTSFFLVEQLHAEAAGKRGVDIVVYPEFGLGGSFTTRDEFLPFCEDIPDVRSPSLISLPLPLPLPFPFMKSFVLYSGS